MGSWHRRVGIYVGASDGEQGSGWDFEFVCTQVPFLMTWIHMDWLVTLGKPLNLSEPTLPPL